MGHGSKYGSILTFCFVIINQSFTIWFHWRTSNLLLGRWLFSCIDLYTKIYIPAVQHHVNKTKQTKTIKKKGVERSCKILLALCKMSSANSHRTWMKHSSEGLKLKLNCWSWKGNMTIPSYMYICVCINSYKGPSDTAKKTCRRVATVWLCVAATTFLRLFSLYWFIWQFEMTAACELLLRAGSLPEYLLCAFYVQCVHRESVLCSRDSKGTFGVFHYLYNSQRHKHYWQ